MRLCLINTNRSRPPISPVGLEYVATATRAAGHEVDVLDLCWEQDWRTAVTGFLGRTEPHLVGMSLRNTDDCMMSGGRSYLDEFAAMVDHVRAAGEAPIVVGGVGFSVLAEEVLTRSRADFGIWGEGEFALPTLLDRLERGTDVADVPRLIYPKRATDGWIRNAPGRTRLDDLPPMHRDLCDNRRYFREGGQIGFETHRGCSGKCVYCADPVAKGHRVRCRPPAAVADEIAALISQGIDQLHTCDAEFNMPLDHALAVCDELVSRRLDNRCRWYAYCAPTPFPEKLARAMRAAGCVGINFGADHGDAGMLKRLGRAHCPGDIEAAVRTCRDQGLVTMVDLLLGAPGETETTIERTIELMRRISPDRVGVSLGIRIYPGTPLAAQLMGHGPGSGLRGVGQPGAPVYYLAPEIAATADASLLRLIGSDPRFFFAPAGPEQDYNYADNQILVDAIARGYRGAYWDILRRVSEGFPP